MFDRQKLFDTGVAGIIAQGGPALATDKLSCRYRGPNNTKCALGHSISDKDYERDMERRSPRFFAGQGSWTPAVKIAKAIGCEDEGDVDFARNFQVVHDRVAMENRDNFMPTFLEHARDFAKANGLNTEVLDRAAPVS